MKQYQFSLKPNDSQYYVVNNIGGIGIVNDYSPIAHACMKWKDFKVTYKRNTSLGGVFREYTNSLNFTKDAQKILRYIFYTQGVEGECILEIRQINTSGLSYDPFISAELDFSNCSDERDFFTINIMDRGLAESLNSLIDVTQQIPLDQPEAITILNDGAKLGASSRWILGDSVMNDSTFPPLSHTLPSILSGRLAVVPTFHVNDVQAATFIVPRDAKYRAYGSPTLSPSTLAMQTNDTSAKATTTWYNVSFDGQIQVNAKIDVQSPATGSFVRYALYITSGAGVRIGTYYLGQTPTLADNVATDVTTILSVTIPSMPSNCTFSLVSEFVRIGGSAGDQMDVTIIYYNDNSFLNVNYQAQISATTCKAFRYKDFADKLIKSIGGDGVLSNYLSSSNTDRFNNWDMLPYNVSVTSGDGVRNVPNADIKTSVQDMLHDAFSQFVIWSEIEGNSLRMEPIPYFLQDTVIATITNITDFRIAPNADYIFNDILVGYDSQDTENVSGKNEFNTEVEFLIDGIKRISKQDDCKSAYIASVYAIEQGRADTYNQDSKDNKFDTDVMLIEVNPTPVSGQYTPFRGVGAVISGVDDPSGIYNVFLSPKRKLLRHLPRIKSMCQKGSAKFQTTDKNPDLVSTFVSGTIVETDNVTLVQDSLNFGTVNSHNVKRWMQAGIYYELKCPSNTKLYNAVKNNPRGLIVIEDKGKIRRGWILESTFTTSTKEGNTLKLIPHPDDVLI